MKNTAAVIAILAGLGAFSATSAAQSGPGQSESFPQRPVRWIAPFPPGGAADIVSRLIGQKLTEAWGQQIVVDNRPGAGGNVGTEIAARALPDGYTVVLVPATFTTYPSLVKKPAYNAFKDFAPITLVSYSPLVLVVNPSLPVKSVQELISLVRAKPGEFNYASSGIGASAHMAAELFKSMTGTKIVHIPYKGQPPAILDLISGRVQIMFPNVPVSLPHIKAGRLRALAVSTAKRSALFPELPTIAKSGLPGFEVTQWSGLLAPAGAPKAIIGKYQRDIAAALSLPDVRQKLVSQGFEAVGNTPGEFSAYIKAEIAKWAKVIREAGIHAD
jgi:tripartite-type tricarboxylate transporter receptor subunit TctC